MSSLVKSKTPYNDDIMSFIIPFVYPFSLHTFIVVKRKTPQCLKRCRLYTLNNISSKFYVSPWRLLKSFEKSRKAICHGFSLTAIRRLLYFTTTLKVICKRKYYHRSFPTELPRCSSSFFSVFVTKL